MKGETKAMNEELKGNDTGRRERAKGKMKAKERAKGKMKQIKRKATDHRFRRVRRPPVTYTVAGQAPPLSFYFGLRALTICTAIGNDTPSARLYSFTVLIDPALRFVGPGSVWKEVWIGAAISISPRKILLQSAFRAVNLVVQHRETGAPRTCRPGRSDAQGGISRLRVRRWQRHDGLITSIGN